MFGIFTKRKTLAQRYSEAKRELAHREAIYKATALPDGKQVEHLVKARMLVDELEREAQLNGYEVIDLAKERERVRNTRN